jgi:cytochrome c oxidase subunit 2
MARSLALAAVLAALVLVPPALANGGIAPPDSATEQGSSINTLYWTIFGISAFVFLCVEGALVWFVFRFRRRRGTSYDADGPQIHGNTRLEIVWTSIPVVILAGIALATFLTIPNVSANPGPGEDALTVKVAAHQFYWQYEYPNGAIAVDELRLPVDRTVRLELTSPDVVHSWWVPSLTGKMDAIPGRTNVMTFRPVKTGTFRGRCAEFCGVEHSAMAIAVEVMPAADFDAWVKDEAAAQAAGGAESDLARATYEGVCAKCHGFAGEGGVGPPIVGKVTTRDGLVRLLTEGQDTAIDGYMPPVGLGWPDRQVDALFELLTTDPTLSGGG